MVNLSQSMSFQNQSVKQWCDKLQFKIKMNILFRPNTSQIVARRTLSGGFSFTKLSSSDFASLRKSKEEKPKKKPVLQRNLAKSMPRLTTLSSPVKLGPKKQFQNVLDKKVLQPSNAILLKSKAYMKKDDHSEHSVKKVNIETKTEKVEDVISLKKKEEEKKEERKPPAAPSWNLKPKKKKPGSKLPPKFKFTPTKEDVYTKETKMESQDGARKPVPSPKEDYRKRLFGPIEKKMSKDKLFCKLYETIKQYDCSSSLSDDSESAESNKYPIRTQTVVKKEEEEVEKACGTQGLDNSESSIARIVEIAPKDFKLGPSKSVISMKSHSFIINHNEEDKTNKVVMIQINEVKKVPEVKEEKQGLEQDSDDVLLHTLTEQDKERELTLPCSEPNYSLINDHPMGIDKMGKTSSKSGFNVDAN